MNDVRAKPSREARNEIIVVLKNRDGYRCYICLNNFKNKTEVTIDHFIPLAHGGTWHIDNLRLACQPCNNKKSDVVPSADGTVYFRSKKSKAPKAPRPAICENCYSGRLLLENEVCDDCGSLPQPLSFPEHRKRKPKNCDHDGITHCWMCVVGLVERKPVINTLLTGE